MGVDEVESRRSGNKPIYTYHMDGTLDFLDGHLLAMHNRLRVQF